MIRSAREKNELSGNTIVNKDIPEWRIVPGGDSCLVVEFDAADMQRSNSVACELARRLMKAALPGVSDIVPSMAAVGVHYYPAVVASHSQGVTPWQHLMIQVQAVMPTTMVSSEDAHREIILPVCYGGEYGEDLEDVARTCGLSTEEVIDLHSGSTVRVLMLGFAPGHPYIGMFDPRLAIGRRPTPRTAVPEGSIGLANRQSVIYPMTLPGGWSLIGRTPLKLFDPYQEPPCLLSAGDRIRFQPITARDFVEIEQQR